MSSDVIKVDSILNGCAELVGVIFARCQESAPNFGVSYETFQAALSNAVRKYLFNLDSIDDTPPSHSEIKQFLNELQVNDLFMALACAAGNERAWWEFDQQHRAYLERVARHLASAETDAEEVVDAVYVELYGTKIVDGVRQSKFASYTGRGSLRGWLRTIVWHALVDLHRSGHDEVSLDELTEAHGEGHTQASFLNEAQGGENEMVDTLVRQRYYQIALAALETSFAGLEDHEKLLLLYYHVENLKMREIARLVEVPSSPLRHWFQRKSEQREKAPETRVHESTVMRWLEKVYSKTLKSFCNELSGKHGLKQAEIELCMEIAAHDLAGSEIYQNLLTTQRNSTNI